MKHDDAAFETAMDQLCKQKVPLNGNANIVYYGGLSPISWLSFDWCWVKMQPHRVARFIEVLYLHCGIPSSSAIFNFSQSPLMVAAKAINFIAFETLVVKCNAALDIECFNPRYRYFLDLEHSISNYKTFDIECNIVSRYRR
jgi:hypothetical protein